MYLIPIDVVRPHIDEYFLQYRSTAKLLGFMPCSADENMGYARYYSVETAKGRVVPVFFVPDMVFVSDPAGTQPGPALFFKGCDDGHTGLRFSSEEEAMQWLDACPYGDFELLFRAACEGGNGLTLCYHN